MNTHSRAASTIGHSGAEGPARARRFDAVLSSRRKPSLFSLPRVAIDDLARFLEGNWHVARMITSTDQRTTAFFQGLASFLRVSATRLEYFEAGTLRTEDTALEAGRSWVLDMVDRSVADISFPDGRPFHRIDLRRGRARSVFLCDSDRYVGTFVAIAPSILIARWRVTGQKKQYVSTTTFNRTDVEVTR